MMLMLFASVVRILGSVTSCSSVLMKTNMARPNTRLMSARLALRIEWRITVRVLFRCLSMQVSYSDSARVIICCGCGGHSRIKHPRHQELDIVRSLHM